MKHYYLIILLLTTIFSLPSFAQKTPLNFTVEYQTFDHGRLIDAENPILIIANTQQTLVSTLKEFEKKQETFPLEEYYIDVARKQRFNLSQLNLKERIGSADNVLDDPKKYTLTGQTKRIQGYLCKKATTTVNSNAIELWFTTEIPVKGAPNLLGSSLGLVLEMTRNKEYRITASKINKNIPFDIDAHVKLANTPLFDALTYQQKIWQSRFINIPIFKNETINYTANARSNDSIFRFAKGNVIVRKIKIPKYKKGSQLFLDVTQSSLGDAYDRTASVFIIPTYYKSSFLDALQNGKELLPIYTGGNGKKYQGFVATPTFNPLIELMRFFTPFGIGKFNHIQIKDKIWNPVAHFRQEITAYAPLLKDREVYIGMYISNYDSAGHQVSADISIHPSESEKEEAVVIMPLFNTVNVLEMDGQEYPTLFSTDKGLFVEFELQKAVNNAQLRYITTGHGGWKAGDEFNAKENKIFVDGKLVHSVIPWREDCGSYRLMNPASGNFKNGLSSSDLSRSNWCPGTVTYPMSVGLGDLAAGKHKIQIRINQGDSQGSSFSYWNVSGVLIGY
ncbi:GLPGLI family protein [Flavobacterium sp. NKUCC04_CG]|uniref:GLPGLI family protein n=1 Tax=Flavobacterium sp. NKUCC04_CG TaxID=2842121 RepID=UPI001C5A9E90|nr:GLPGLI family protein [Flavobacterium sp. NKUCC04_CG]MBW3517720.1 GLPGLI family protein [Flavobacterium sp. NKUCC04_CG]